MSQETMNSILTLVIVPVLIALTSLIVNFLRLKAKEISDKIKDEKLKKYIAIAEDAIETAVVAVMQTYVNALSKEGKFDKAAQKKAFEMAKCKAIIIMGTAAKDAIKEAYGSIDEWLDNSIEYYVNVNKKITA